MDFRSSFSVRGEPPVGLIFNDKSRTRQEFLKESLTTTIIDRFTKTGILNATVNPERQARFGDFSEMPNDSLDLATRIKDIESDFMSLPSSMRSKFGNSPLVFVNFISDPRNRSKAEDLGIFPRKAKVVEKAAEAAKPADGAEVAPAKAEAEAKA